MDERFGLIPEHFHEISRLEKYCHLGTIKTYQKGEKLLFPGQKLERFVYILSGKVKLTYLQESGEEKLMMFFTDDAVMNYLFTYPDDPTIITATEKTKVCLFSMQQLEQVCLKDISVVREILQNQSDKVTYFSYKFLDMETVKSEQRIYQLLYRLCQSRGSKLSQNSCAFKLELSQKEIAEIVGVHFVTLSRIFKKLKDDGILSKNNSDFIIHNIRQLRDLSEALT